MTNNLKELEETGSTKTLNSNSSSNSNGDMSEDPDVEEKGRWWWILSWVRWRFNSRKALKKAESSILQHVKSPYNARYVDIGPVLGPESCKIWTVSLNENSSETPLVLIHGLASGVALWALNLDELSAKRPLYAIDVLGFGRSSRPVFSTDANEAEEQFVKSIEAWRNAMGIKKFILLGHSLGAYLVTAYSIRFPEPVDHLILADPWGFKDKPTTITELGQRRVPLIARIIVQTLEPMNPLLPLRLVGPLGPRIIQFARSDLIRNFLPALENAPMHVSNYIFQCNAQNPTGESAYHSMMATFAWAKNAMHHRIHRLDAAIPMTLIYGSKSWVDHYPGEGIQEIRKSSYVATHILEGSGHHVYADKKQEFNEIVLYACTRVKGQPESECITEKIEEFVDASLVTGISIEMKMNDTVLR